MLNFLLYYCIQAKSAIGGRELRFLSLGFGWLKQTSFFQSQRKELWNSLGNSDIKSGNTDR
jgi:hypothetical protein